MIYLASPTNQIQADYCREQPVLLSFACFSPFLTKWIPSFDSILIDSGAYSVMSSGKRIDPQEYAAWVSGLELEGSLDAWAALDDIEGDWRKSLANLKHGGFPTFHDTDPPELLDELIDIAVAGQGWIGIGLKPPRGGKDDFVRRTIDRIPDGVHVHGWALAGEYSRFRRFDSFDSTGWWRIAMRLRKQLPWLTYGECLEITVKMYKRWWRRDERKKEQMEFTFE